ncbi:HAD-IA family hydrolase [Rhodovibrionaceae bacterium A322]
MSSAFDLILFDFDGTLVDSQNAITRCMGRAFETVSLAPPSRDEVRRIVGLTLEIAIEKLLPGSPSPDMVAQVSDNYRKAFFAYRQEPNFEEPLFPGVRETLPVLNQPEVLLGVATGKNMRGLTHSLETHGLRDLFVTLQTPDHNPGKPHPGMVERAAAQTGCDISRTVVIGDTTFDMEMAVNAGATPVGVNWGYHHHEELTGAGARIIVEQFADLPEALASLA